MGIANIGENGPTTVVAITGPPASGKSTITDIISDIDVPVVDTGDEVRRRAREVLDDPNEDEIWDWVSEKREERGDHAPTAIAVENRDIVDADVVAVSGLREQGEVEWLRANVGPTLVVKVDAPSYIRSKRYVDRELDDNEDMHSINRQRLHGLRKELYDREEREEPYPDHSVTLWNGNDVSMVEMVRKVEELFSVLER